MEKDRREFAWRMGNRNNSEGRVRCSAGMPMLESYREKVFAIIGVKVYAAAFYVGSSVTENLHSWNGKSAADILEASSVFTFLYQAPLEKSLNIVLVRDVDGKTFWKPWMILYPRIKTNVNLALYDGFFGNSPVSPTLKASAAHGLQMNQQNPKFVSATTNSCHGQAT
ncbi:Fatty-acid-binding protein 3, chloroplastic, partial [Ananas comosus]